MKKLIVLILPFLMNSLWAYSLETHWSMSSEKSVRVYCDQNESFCSNLCGEIEFCEVEEKVCENCVSTSIEMTYIFDQIGKLIASTGEKVSDYDLIDLLDSKNFVSLTSKSVYNITGTFNSRGLRNRFRSLCEEPTAYPHVFFDKHADNALDSVKYVWCVDGLYKMINGPEALKNNNLY